MTITNLFNLFCSQRLRLRNPDLIASFLFWLSGFTTYQHSVRFQFVVNWNRLKMDGLSSPINDSFISWISRASKKLRNYTILVIRFIEQRLPNAHLFSIHCSSFKSSISIEWARNHDKKHRSDQCTCYCYAATTTTTKPSA